MILASFAFAFLSFFPHVPTVVASETDTASTTERSNDARFEVLDGLLKSAVDSGTVVGHNAMVLQDGKVLYYGQFGQRDRARNLPMERDTIFRIYSMTKPITSVAAMQLVEAGKIKLDEPVASYIPEFANLKVLRKGKLVKPRREISIRDLMRHSSGLTYGFFGDTPVDQMYKEAGILVTDKSLEDLVDKLVKLPLQGQPRLRFHYGVSTDVLARVIEVTSGEEFSQYLKKHIFDPLGMRDTFFTVPKDKLHRFAEMYKSDGENLKPASVQESHHFLNETGLHSGGGGLCSTIDDYLQFCQVLIQEGSHGGHQILKPESLAEMFVNQLEDLKYSASWFQFGLGFYIEPKEGDYSWAGTAGTGFWVNPKRKLTILYMTQIMPYENRDVGDRLRQKTYGILGD